MNKAKKRMAWLLLVDTYRVRRIHKRIANKFVRSKLFKNLGANKIYTKYENYKYYILLKKSSLGMKNKWEEDVSRKIENKEIELKRLRKN